MKEKCYYTGTRQGQILHARLRLECSDLNEVLHRKNLVASPACSCGHPRETTDHYLHECPNYRLERTALYQSVAQYGPITTNLLLYGKNELDHEINTSIFDNVQKFLLQTNRFK